MEDSLNGEKETLSFTVEIIAPEEESSGSGFGGGGGIAPNGPSEETSSTGEASSESSSNEGDSGLSVAAGEESTDSSEETTSEAVSLSDDTVVGGQPWASLKTYAMEDDYSSQGWFTGLSDEDKALCERLRVA